MKIVTSLALAALLAAPTVAMAQKSTTKPLPNLPGQSEFAPGQRAKIQGGSATDYAPGQMKTRNVKKGASSFAPGHQTNTNTMIRR